MIKKLFGFHGGIHPPQNKNASCVPIVEMPAPKVLLLPLIQSIGQPSKPLVSKGDTVYLGQKIAEPAGLISATLHSPVSGHVLEISKKPHPLIGADVESIVIENDEKYTKQPDLKTHADFYSYSVAELIDTIKESGIVGLSGSAFPTHVKLKPPHVSEINTLILNGCECEPYLTCDDRLMQENAREIVEGTKLMMHILNAVNAIIAVEDNKKLAIKNLKKFTYNEPNIDVAVLETRYPQGSEKQLVRKLTGKKIQSGQLPFSVGVVINNVSTAYAVCRALKEGENLVSRVVTVCGSAVKQPKNLRVRIGSSLKDILSFCGETAENAAQIIMGGPMMGVAQISLDAPVVKATTGIILLDKKDVVDKKYNDCFRCGKCVRACPMELCPNMISVASENGVYEDAKEYFISDCIECGSCAYLCPAKRPIVQQVKWAKSQQKGKN